MLSSVGETVHYELRQIFRGAGVPSQYLRIEPALGAASEEMDDASATNRTNLVQAGDAAVADADADLDAFVELLVAP